MTQGNAINNDGMMAISIRQPYVELILQGKKTKEYRSRPTTRRGRVLLYATQTDAETELWGMLSRKEIDNLPYGRIVGEVEIVSCEWDQDCYAYLLANPVRYDKPERPVGTPQPCFWRNVKAAFKRVLGR